MNADLTYNIAEGTLAGAIGGVPIRCGAGSGGRAGSKVAGAVNSLLANNAMATHVHAGVHAFGPLPQGLYHMVPHERDPNMVRLTPFESNIMFGRSGFLIHGRGQIGSHGCIVPNDFSDVLRICSAVARAQKAGKTPVLKVIAVGADPDAAFNRARNTA